MAEYPDKSLWGVGRLYIGLRLPGVLKLSTVHDMKYRNEY